MKKQHSLLAITLVLSLFLLNCKEKQNIIPTTKPPTPTYSSLDEVFLKQGLQYKTVMIDAGKDASFYGNSGTRYEISANSLVAMDGTPITGEVKVEVCEYLNNGDMIFSKMLPISNGQPLISGGELDIKASQLGQPLRLDDGKTFTANVPQIKAPDPDMQFFRGVKVEGEQNQVNWVVPVKDSFGQGKDNRVMPKGVDTLSILSDSLALCNADRFMTNPNYKSFKVTIVVTGAVLTDADKVLGYALYDTYKGMWPFFSYSKGVFNETHVPGIPVHFVAFTLIGGEFYGGTLGVTPEDGKNYTLTLTKIDAAAFKKQLNSM